MKNFPILVTFFALVTCFTSCKKVYEEVPLGQQIPLEIAFDEKDSSGTYALRFLLSTYAEALPQMHNRIAGNYLDAASDDAITSQVNLSDVDRLQTGAYSASNTNGDNVWQRNYYSIRNATVFATLINRVPLAEKLPDGRPARPAYRSEARFLRAMLYFDLVKRYGGVPLLGDQIRQIDDEIQLPRNSFEECITYIVGELDNIKDSLRVKEAMDGTHYGRVTKGAAMALKARVLLYAASPLFNGGNVDPSNPLTGYIAADPNRWKLAADAAKAVIDLNSYSLMPSFQNAFITQGAPVGSNTESIFWRQSGPGTGVEKDNGPVGYASAGGNGVTSPTQNLVDAFPAINGLPITDPASGFDPNDPYANRDPRLKYTVFVNGMLWLNREVASYVGGADRPGGSLQQTKTGYYMRKFMGNFETSTTGVYQDTYHDFIYLRYAEVLLNYAEALNEFSGPSTDVFDVLHQLRQRAGIEPGADNSYGIPASATQEELRELIHNERRVEMAFEEQRYFDIRRWKVAPQVFASPLRGVNVLRTSQGLLTFDYVNVATGAFRDPQMYLYPIPYTEVIKNPQMRQNPQW
ncbi:MAG: RagB/SusD family nutrient uptake outer membrane protein [Chitinophagaceae bacterium]|nr:MAG: RagB/SusD family nutrient uptake outer membrane protein [Chitinophagaceae bacterium]